MTKNKKQLKGGTFNLRYGRPVKAVKGEVEHLLQKHNLDFLCLQEAVDYTKEMRKVAGYDYIYDPKTWSGKESTILVKSTLKQDRVKFHQLGDGWVTVNGGNHPPTGQAEVRIDGWLFVRSLHLPTPSVWKGGKLIAPAERKDDYIAAVNGLARYLRFPATRNARIAAGDWNEPDDTLGEYSPRWLANKTNSITADTKSRAGHGRIDWVMAKGATIPKCFKDLEIREGSDHEPVIFVVRKK
jgi:exonuclease III